jgi:hypothetical protein
MEMGMLLFLCTLGCREDLPPLESHALTPEELVFGEVPVGAWAMEPVYFQNTGESSIEILSADVIEVTGSVWALSWDEARKLLPEQGTLFELTFTPALEETYGTKLQIRTTMKNHPIVYVELTGDGGPSIVDGDGDGYSPADGDCDDGNADISPGVEEECDGIDNDCDGALPAEESDSDSDGWRLCAGDCDDQDSEVYPDASEICDGKDSDCDGENPDDEDYDGDGQTRCDGDCDDQDPDRFLGNEELCDYIDNNCSGYVDDTDSDGDGHSPCESGGDCNDADPLAHPVVFDEGAAEGGDGSVEHPYSTWDDALEGIDDICRTVMVAPGTHHVEVGWAGGFVRIKGAGRYPEDVTLKPWSGSNSRLFRLYPGSGMELINMTMFNAFEESGGSVVYANLAELLLQDLVMIDNQSNAAGGAVFMEDGVLQIIDCEFSYNATGASGGAVHVASSTFLDSGSKYVANQALLGGGVMLDGTDASISDVYFGSNFAGDEGGGIAVYNDSSVELSRTRFWENGSISKGGAILMRDLGSSPFLMLNLRFQDNDSVDGGAVALVGSQASGLLANSTFAGNAATGAGGDIYAVQDLSEEGVYLWGNIHSHSGGSSALHAVESAGANVYFNSCHSPAATCFSIPESAGAGLNSEQDPLFNSFTDDGNAQNDDLGLQPSSPAIDAGPVDGAGPGYYTSWTDVDGTSNDQGYTGGPSSLE